MIEKARMLMYVQQTKIELYTMTIFERMVPFLSSDFRMI